MIKNFIGFLSIRVVKRIVRDMNACINYKSRNNNFGRNTCIVSNNIDQWLNRIHFVNKMLKRNSYLRYKRKML